MTINLLANPGFEGSGNGEWTRDTHSGEEHGNWFTPEGWIGWWNPRQARPEAHVIPLEPPFIGPPTRIHEGHYACKLHKSFDDWSGGHYQVVEGLTPGKLYEAGFHAHAWCNHDGLPNAGDPNCAPMACGPFYLFENELPPLSGDPVQDAWWAARFQVGVQFLASGQNPDPTYNVVWALAAAIYNGYAAVPMLEFRAEKPRLAFFMRAELLWDYRNNDAYFDSAWLTERAEPPAREYSRTYVLLPNNQPFDPAEQVRISALHPGVTVGPSADDAAIPHPNLTEIHIISYKPHTWGGKDALEAFWFKYYDFPQGGDSLDYREDDEPPPPNPILLAQRDPAWADLPFGDDNCHSTIGEQGCFITDLAMAQRFYGIDTEATPVTVDGALGPAGYSGCVANWRGASLHFEAQLRIGVSGGTATQALEHIDAGGCAMAELLPTEREHFVLAIGYRHIEYGGADIEFDVLDPWTDTQYWMPLERAQSWRILTHVEPPPILQLARVGLHMQAPDGDWLGYARDTGGPMKFVNLWTELLNCKRASPESPIVYRHWVPKQPIGAPDKLALMRGYVDMFRSDMENVCEILTREGFEQPFFGVEGYNETYACWAPSLYDAIACDRAFVRALAETGLPVVPVTFCAAVGNIQLPSEDPGGDVWPLLLELARETAAAGGGWGYHPYWFANPAESGLVEHWSWLAGRWTLFDEYLVEHGVELDWHFGEMGAVGGCAVPGGGYDLHAHSGWRAPDCYGGDWSRYVTDLITFSDMVKGWNDSHGNRAKGGMIFTVGAWDWASFLLRDEEMRSLAAALS